MRTKVYSFKPKGKGYTVYATNTYHGKSGISKRSPHSARSSGVGSILIGMFAKGIIRGIFGKKR